MTASDTLKKQICALPRPENYYRGVRMPVDFELPNEILMFYHDFCLSTLGPTTHYRYTLVFPWAEMTYYVDQDKYCLHEGDILFIPPYSLRFLAPQSAGYQRFFITFQLKNKQPYLPEGKLYHWSDEAETLICRILESYKAGDDITLALTLYELLQTLASKLPSRYVAEKHAISDEISRSLAFINDNLHNQLDIRQIAGKVNMSASNIALRFRREIGMPIHQYILHQRLGFACYCLRETNMRLDEIAQRCSFESASSFSHFFKSKTGKSPMAWRKANQQKAMNEESRTLSK